MYVFFEPILIIISSLLLGSLSFQIKLLISFFVEVYLFVYLSYPRITCFLFLTKPLLKPR